VRAKSVLADGGTPGNTKPRNVVEELAEIARRVRRIGDGWRSDPETIAIEKDELASRIRRAARQLAAGGVHG